jgi:hypothetical protein
MTSEPSNADLAWRLDQIARRLDDVIGRAEYTADRRGLDRELAELRRDLDEERRMRSEAIKATSERLDEQARSGAENRMHWRTLLWTGVIPALVALIGVAVTLLISHGGH